MDAPVVYMMLGMHKSETTLVARMLHEAGLPMVAKERGDSYDAGNQYERGDTNRLNRDMLDAVTTHSLDVVEHLNVRSVAQEHLDRATKITETCNQMYPGGWGFKNPRLFLTYRFWLTLLEKPRFVLVYRDAAAVRRHYVGKGKNPVLGGMKALRAWAVHNQVLIDILNDFPRQKRHLISYDRLMGDAGELRRLEGFLGRSVPDRRSGKLNRNAVKPGLAFALDAFLVRLTWGFDVRAIQKQLDAFLDRQSKG